MACDYYTLTHAGIKTLSPYVPGKSIEELAKEQGISDIIKLASNENPLGCSHNVQEMLANLSGIQIATYPSPIIHPLNHKLADKLAIEANRLILSNGSDLLFCMLLMIFGTHNNKHILTHDKAFISYAIQAQTQGIAVKSTPLLANWQVDIDAMVNACNEDTALIFLANPNNPTGVLIPSKDIQRLLAAVAPSTIVVIDEAYYEYAFASDDQGALAFANQYPNLVITRTFSKAWGLAGLRLGYAIANPDIIELIQRVQLPFAVNQAALAAGFTALDDTDFLAQTLTLNAEGLSRMRQGLDNLEYSYLPSSANFITFDCKKNSLPIYQDLLKQGIIVRPLTPYGLHNHLRVSIGTLEHVDRFLETLAIITSKHAGLRSEYSHNIPCKEL